MQCGHNAARFVVSRKRPWSRDASCACFVRRVITTFPTVSSEWGFRYNNMHTFYFWYIFLFPNSNFFHARRFWACATSWWLIHTSCRCGIPPALAHCCTHPVLNCRGRCWLLCHHMFLWAWTVTVRVEVRYIHYFSFNKVDNTIFQSCYTLKDVYWV